MTSAQPWVEVTEYGPSQGDLTAVTGWYVQCVRCNETHSYPKALEDRKDREVEKHNACTAKVAA